MSARGKAVLFFAAGVLCAVIVGCIIAAYDLWGGVPRDLRWPMRILAIAGTGFLIRGAIGFVRAQQPETRTRSILKAIGVLAGLAIVVAGALITYYVARWDSSRAICETARRLPKRADRERELVRGLGPLFPVIDPNGECTHMKREMDDLQREQTCPQFVIDDAPCVCGREKWIGPQSAGRCPSAATTCESRADNSATYLDRQGLGCERPRAY